jgi:hypothetical protein
MELFNFKNKKNGQQFERNPDTEKIGKAVVQHFRDEIYQPFIDEKEQIIETGIDKYNDELNSLICDDLRNLMIERAELFCSLTNEQNKILNRLILNTIDSVAFNVMRALDENDSEKSGVILKINNIEITKLRLIGNGNLSGEYFDWVERFSKYGHFQH